MIHIKERTIGESWIKTFQAVLKANKTCIYDGSVKIIEKIPVVIEITNPILPDEIIKRYGQKEFVTFMERNFSDMASIENWGYSYAQRLYDFEGVNQVSEIVKILKSNPNAKSATINLLSLNGDKFHKPCLTSLDVKIRDGKLLVIGFFRSQDVGKKMYADALELYKIGHSIGKELGIQDISLMHLISSAHIYESDIDKIQETLNSLGSAGWGQVEQCNKNP